MRPVEADTAAAERPTVRQISLDGTHKKRLDKGRSRLLFVMAAFLAVYGVIAGRLVLIAMDAAPREQVAGRTNADAVAAARPDILDRTGAILATDVRQPSLFAEPRRIIDADEAAEQLAEIFPDMQARELRQRLTSGRGFVWLRREISPEQQQRVHALGLPGIGFLDENRRVYPAGRTASHIVGHVNVDNAGIAGLEKWIDTARGLSALHQAGFALDRAQEPVRLSVDLRVQHAMRNELVDAMQRYQAIAAFGALMNVRTGEIVGLVSLPDYDPNEPREALLPDRINRVTTGTYELGSVFKAFTIAMALESGRFNIASGWDARAPLSFGGMRIRDFHGQNRVLSTQEVFTYSSNIGTARMALAIGLEQHRAFLQRMGLLERLRTELPESAAPLFPRQWRPVNSATIGFGHGITVAPLQALAGTAALMNGGYLVRPTFELRTAEEARRDAPRVVSEQTSATLRQLFRLNVERGSGRRAEAEGYLVGGKTGTAEKVVNGRYASNRLLTSFLSGFPMDAPEYVMLVSLDEPQRVAETGGVATAGVNAAPLTSRIVRRIAPLLGIEPRIPRLAEQPGVPETTATIPVQRRAAIPSALPLRRELAQR